MPTHTFTGPKVKATRTGTCPTCGKPSKRSRTYERTVSPFNKRTDGTPKSWGEVRADVQADADAWVPEPDEFEHDRCLAARMAPEPAEPAVMSEQAQARAQGIRLALADTILWLERAGVRAPRIEARPPQPQQEERYVVEVAFIDAADVPAWCRALGLDTVPIEDGGHCDYARLRADAGGLTWHVHGILPRPEYGDRLGGVPIEWRRDSNGRRTGRGTVALDDLSAGLARMGIAETLTPSEVRARAQAARDAERQPLLDDLRERMAATSRGDDEEVGTL